MNALALAARPGYSLPMTTDANIATLRTALDAYRVEYVERFVEAQRAADMVLVEKLQAAGGRMNAVFPLQLDRKSMKQAEAGRTRLGRICTFNQYASDADGKPIRGGVYTYDEAKHEASFGRVRAAAEESFYAYVLKLAGKVEGVIETAEVEGDLWSGSTLTLTVDGERQTWKTKCILNRSALGTVFNQFPTRRSK